MALTGNIVAPYPTALTDASWKAAKTAGIRDKWNTELGAALRAAQAAYNLIKFEQLVLQDLEAKKGKLVTIPDVQAAKTGAQLHYKVTVKPAIKALETAKSKSATASLNPVITAGARTKAGQMSAFLGSLLTLLKSFKTTDYDTRLADLQRKYQATHATFAAKMKVALSDARKFIAAVRLTPTVKTYNTGIQDAARGLSQLVGNVERMQKSGLDVGKPGPWATNLFHQLTPRAEGHADLPTKAKTPAVLIALQEFEDMVDDVDEWWN